MSKNLIDDPSPRGGSVSDAVWTTADVAAMTRARDLARQGAGRTGPNPTVGAVVMRDGREVGAGFHRRHGDAHAEVVALEEAGDTARGSTLYVTLEPCAHQGHTPPCVDRIIESGVTRVVCPAIDPDPRVRGRGIETLRTRGIRVDVGCLAEALVLDTLAFYRARLGLPWTVSLKMAVSADDRVARAPGQRDVVTGERARADTHALRAVHDAVVVGIETVLIDRPRLDCRLLPDGVDRDPIPVVLDTHARMPIDNEWVRAGRGYIVACGPEAEASRVAALERTGARVLRVAANARGLDVRAVVGLLAELGLSRVMVEGGPRVFWSFVDAECWNAAWLYRSERVFGPAGVPLFRSPGERFPGRMVDAHAWESDRRLGFVEAASWAHLTSALAGAK